MKGPGNTNGVSAPAGDGRHTGKESLQPQLVVTAPQHHTMQILTLLRPTWLPRTQLFPVIPDSHCTVFLRHTQDTDLACCTCENCVYFMYLPVCCLPTELGRKPFEIAEFHSLITSSVSALVAVVCEIRIPCKQFLILLSH